MWDVFISYASEDRPFVEQLAVALEQKGLNVWFDQTTLKLGDSLRRSIDGGLKESTYGIVVLSPAFFAKSWTQYELDGLATMEMAYGNKRILPLWHNVTQFDVMRYSPSLAGKMAVSTNRGLDSVVKAILEVVKPSSSPTQTYQESPTYSVSPQVSHLETRDLVRILDLLDKHFNTSELMDVCFHLGVDFDDLSGGGKRDKTRELVSYLNRRGRIQELITLLRTLRPQVNW